MTIYVPGKLVLRKESVPFDYDAWQYIAAVEAEDGEILEQPVRNAITNFVIGCKADGIWDAIKASCILAGARTLAGALVPLVGTAPTNVNFVAGDYDRETGLKGDGSTKYLDSNRNNNADPQNDCAFTTYVTEIPVSNSPSFLLASANVATGSTSIGYGSDEELFFRHRNSNADVDGQTNLDGFIGISRATSTEYTARFGGSNTTYARASQAPYNGTIAVFTEGRNLSFKTNARLAFYSIGESLDLAALDTRVTNLINAIGVAIP